MERKISVGGGIGIPLSVILVWIWNSVLPDMVMPGEVSAALGALLTMGLGWVIPNK